MSWFISQTTLHLWLRTQLALERASVRDGIFFYKSRDKISILSSKHVYSKGVSCNYVYWLHDILCQPRIITTFNLTKKNHINFFFIANWNKQNAVTCIRQTNKQTYSKPLIVIVIVIVMIQNINLVCLCWPQINDAK